MKLILAILLGSLMVTFINAHAHLINPPPINSQKNQYKNGKVDNRDDSPLSNERPWPCQGKLSEYNGRAGTPVATWAAGSTQRFTIETINAHGGGSCQLSFSVDGGRNFRVVKSYIGGCPRYTQGNEYFVKDFSFQVPRDVPSNDKAIFAWTWHTRKDLRETYMNCAVIKITGGANNDAEFNRRPLVFNANNPSTNCKTTIWTEVRFPQPGPDVEGSTNSPDPLPGCPKAASPNNNVPGYNNNQKKNNNNNNNNDDLNLDGQCNTWYTTKVAGESCDDIARNHGISTARFKALNGFINCNDVWQGTNCCVQKPSRGNNNQDDGSNWNGQCNNWYKSHQGDNCDNISQKYGISVARFKRMNSFINCDDIWSGTNCCVDK